MKNSVKNLNRIRGMLDIKEGIFLNRLAEKTVKRFGEDAILCEIGSFCGKSTVAIATALLKNKCGKLYAIDWHQGSLSHSNREHKSKNNLSTLEEFRTNIERFGVADKVITIKKKSQDSIEDVPEKIHFLFIDASHVYEDVKADYNNYQHKLVEGGYLLFHDACWTTHIGPLEVICESILDNKTYNLYALIGNTMIFRKEMNRISKFNRDALKYLCKLVSGEKRGFIKKVLSFILFRITTYYTFYLHNWEV
ncbi:MAG: class I SAM-dependent methyltransferase [Atribacterota bacterium]|nr:class I SAM-dependent methyltransferase [Atribacterota bacterium]